MKYLITFFISILIISGCAETDKQPTGEQKERGTIGGLCYSDGTCNQNLSCIDGICEEVSDPCQNIICDEWKSCVSGSCELKLNRCDRNSDCVGEQTCDSNHNCVDPFDPCDGVSCSNHGNCIASNNAPLCVCDVGYVADGLNCIAEVSPCEGVTCSDHGDCAVSNSSPICVCDQGYIADGLNCIDPCEGVNCQEWQQCNGGTCELKSGRCEATNDCIGEKECDENHNCVDPDNPCEGVTCSNHGSCVVSNDAAVCVCDNGYYPEGLTCINPCEGVTCSNSGSCAVTDGDPICVCNDGFTGDNCERCLSGYYGSTCLPCPGGVDNICSGFGSCDDGKTGSGVCSCQTGYAGSSCETCDSGYQLENNVCVAIDYCDGVTCSNHGECISDEVEYICVCETGYTGDNCESCEDGYQLSGGECIPDVDLCEGVTCSNHGECLSDATEYICVCDTEYTGDNCESCDSGYFDSGDGTCTSYNVEWCNIQWPSSYSESTGVSESIYGRLLINSLTGSNTSYSFVKGRVCYSEYSDMSSPTCIPASINPSCSNCGSNDEYISELQFSQAGTYYYIFQFSANNGDSWVSCDTTDNSSYDVNDAGVATITGGGVEEGDIFISEYIEGSGQNKILELYNPKGVAIDLSNYELWKTTNGTEWGSEILDLTGYQINANSVFIIGNGSADIVSTDIMDIVEPEQGFCSWNGNDAVALVKDGTIIDVIGISGDDPGNGWDVAGIANGTKNHTLVRKPSITTGNSDWSTSAGTDEATSEWIVNDEDFTNIGAHTVE